jgi:hypothetical protein
MSESNIDEILNKWYKAKEEISILEKDCEKYKSIITNNMDSKGEDEIIGKNYHVKRNIICKKTISKNNIPSNIWDLYSKSSVYPLFQIKKRK